MRVINIVFLIAIVVVLGVLSFLNKGDVTFKYFFGEGKYMLTVPMYYVFVVTFLAGALYVYLFSFISRVKLKWQIRRMQKQIRAYETDISKLRNMPLTTETTLTDSKAKTAGDSPARIPTAEIFESDKD